MKHIAIIRSTSSALSNKLYNIQEIGLAKELARRGMIVDVFLASGKTDTHSETLEGGKITVYWIKGINIPGQQAYYPDLNRILNRNHYDLIQALDDSQLTTILVSSYCRKHNIKFVLWQGMYENYPEKYKRMIQYVFDATLLKLLRKNTKYCIAKTTSAKKYLEMKRFSNISVIPVGLETKNFKKEYTIDYREKFGIPKSKKILLYVGKVEERRKPLFCLDVYKRAKLEYEDICMVYVGSGPMLEQAHGYAKSNSIRDIYFVDKIPQNELPDLYAASSMFILPTRYEIFGMVLMEAMYFGTPVITYKAAGPIDVIDNGIDGIVMDEFDAEKWAGKIVAYLQDDELNRTMSNNAKKKIKETYLWDNVAARYYEAYMNIINTN